MKKKLLAILVMTTMALSLAACGSSSNSSSATSAETQEPEPKEYITEDQIPDMFTNPDTYKGKYVKLSGQVFADPETSGDQMAIQVCYDIVNYEKDFVVYCSSDSGIKMNDYIEVDGEIDGTITGENYFGAELTFPLIIADSITAKSYIDAVVPTINEITPENAVSEQHDISLKVDKVEFAETETRIYLTQTNNSSDNFDMYTYDMKIVQNGTQYEQNWDSMTQYEAELPELSDTILPGATSSGVVIFPALDSSSSFQLYVEGYSDNWDLDFDAFIIEIQPAQ